MKIGERIRARVVERPGQHPIVTKVDDVHDDHGPGEFVVLEQGKDGYFEVERFGSVSTNEEKP